MLPGTSYYQPFPAPTNDRIYSHCKDFGPSEGFETAELKVLQTPVTAPVSIVKDVKRAKSEEQAALSKFDTPTRAGLSPVPSRFNQNEELREREAIIAAHEARPLDAVTRRRRFETGLELLAAIEFGGVSHIPVENPNPFKS